jgi:hypothetical protein
MIRNALATALLTVTTVVVSASMASAQTQTSRPFTGAKVNGGTVTSTVKAGRIVLTLSDDFKVPDTPDPHWQVVDSRGQVFLLQRLGVKSLGGLVKDRVNMSLTLPDYVKDVAVVQIYCSWAEAVLGEAPLVARTNTTR